MLNVPPRSRTSDVIEQGTQDSGFDASAVQRVIRERWPIVLFVTVLFLFASAVYVLTARPLFTATTGIMIDTRKNQLFQSQQVVGDQQVDAGMVESQVEILKSEGVALSVIRELKLTDEAEFVRPGGSLIGTIVSAIMGGREDPQSQTQLERRATNVFLSNLSVRRVGLTYVLEVNYASPSPAMAARVANGIADAYMVGELEARYQATKRASRWLQDRIAELRQQAQVADLTVQTFKSQNDIVGTNRGLMSDQQLGDVNAQLITARSTTAEAKARLDRIQETARGDIPDGTVTDALRSDIISRLRAQYLDLAAREADWSNRFGPMHTAVQNIRNQMREIKKSISDEIRRIAETYKSEYEIARAREQSVQEGLAGLVNQAANSGQAQVQLRDLESSAQTARNLYDAFLQRSMEATQQQTFPITDARVITVATEPARKSHPKTLLVLAGAGGLGLFAGMASALVRGRLDRSLKTLTEVEQVTGQLGLGILPALPSRAVSASPVRFRVEVPPERRVIEDLGRLRYVVEKPFSRSAETLRSAKVEIDSRGLTHEIKVIGITSSVPREGKTTVSANMAEMVAHSGSRTLLIDGDLRNPSLSSSMVPDAEGGLLDVLAKGAREEEFIWTDPVTGLNVLPANSKERTPYTAELIGSRAMSELLARVKDRYDYVFVDLPPILPVVDVRAASQSIDAFVFVVEWGKTSRDVVLETLGSAETVRQRLIGIILNKASPSALKRVEAYKGRYYRSYYYH